MTTTTLLLWAPMLSLVVWAAVLDIRTRRIPNWLTFTLIVSGVAHSLLPGAMLTPTQSLLGSATGFGLTLAMFILGALGGGDVKLLSGAGAWLGWEAALKVFVIAAVVGLVIVLAQALMQGRMRTLFRNSTVLAMNLAHLGDVGVEHVKQTGTSSRSVDRPLPYAVPVLVAIFILMLGSWRYT